MWKLSVLFLFIACGADLNPDPIDYNRDQPPAITETMGNLPSQFPRSKKTSILVLDDAKALMAQDLPLPEGYRRDDVYESDVIHYDKSFPFDCGRKNESELLDTLEARIEHCKTTYGETKLTFWDATSNGMSGESNWTLVSVIDSQALWLDRRTGLVWSPFIKETKLDGPLSELCENYAENNLFSMGKSQVRWFLPSRSDFLQADIDGARFVLSDLDTEYWSATQIDADSVWTIKQSSGASHVSAKDQSFALRCAGIYLK